MSSSQAYPTVSGSTDPESLCGGVAAGVGATEWYTPGTYTFHDPYITPYPSSTMESQPWTVYSRSSVPDIQLAAYGMHQPHQQLEQQPQHLFPVTAHQQRGLPGSIGAKDTSRPRSSPSTFGPIPWTTSGLGIQYTTAACGPTPMTSTFPPNIFQTYQPEEYYGVSSPPEIRQPQPRRAWTNIAPNPEGIVAASAKRRHDDDDQATSAESSTSKRRKRTSSVVPADLNDDDRFLVQLKEDEGLPWKDIASRFQTETGKMFQVAALQMRYKRLREKFRVWEDEDVQALKLAHEYWEKSKWEIISAKMTEHGVSERWPPRHCARKLQELEGTVARTPMATAGMTPASLSQFSSPIDGPVHFAFMPLS